MTSAVLDANIIASGILGYRNSNSIPGAILRAWRRGEFILFTSTYIRREVKGVLRKKYFTDRLNPQEISRIQTLLQFQAKQVTISKSVQGVASHPEDDLILATALNAKADYLVTGDQRLRDKIGTSYEGVSLITPTEFLQVIQAQP